MSRGCTTHRRVGVSAEIPCSGALDRKGLPHWWAPLQDAQRAVSLVKRGAIIGKWGGAVNVLSVTGFFAGGHPTAHVSTAGEERSGDGC